MKYAYWNTNIAVGTGKGKKVFPPTTGMTANREVKVQLRFFLIRELDGSGC